MELCYQFVYGIELQFRTGATNEGQSHGLIVNVSIKIKDMHLNATVMKRAFMSITLLVLSLSMVMMLLMGVAAAA